MSAALQGQQLARLHLLHCFVFTSSFKKTPTMFVRICIFYRSLSQMEEYATVILTLSTATKHSGGVCRGGGRSPLLYLTCELARPLLSHNV